MKTERFLNLVLKETKRNQVCVNRFLTDLNVSIKGHSIDAIINELEQNKYIVKVDEAAFKNFHRITVAGELFVNKGGYVRKKRIETISFYYKIISSMVLFTGACLAVIYSVRQGLQENQKIYQNTQERYERIANTDLINRMQKEILRKRPKVLPK